MAIAAVFIAKLLDPITMILAIVAGACARALWQVLIASFAIAFVGELALSMLQLTRVFDPQVFSLGIMAAGTWGLLAFGVRRWREQRRARKSTERTLGQP